MRRLLVCVLAAFLAPCVAQTEVETGMESSPPPAATKRGPGPTLVWLVIDDGSRRTIASAAQVAALTAMTDAAVARGVRLEFPALDGNDLARIDADTLWSGDPRRALAAAQRYGASAALIARLSRNGPMWQGRMTLVDPFGSEQYTAEHPDSSSVLADAAKGLADRLQRRRAIAAGERIVADHHLWITNIGSASDYARALKYLESLPVVEAIAPEGAEGDRLLVRARLTVRLDRLRDMLALGDVMALEVAPPEPGQPAVLRLNR